MTPHSRAQAWPSLSLGTSCHSQLKSFPSNLLYLPNPTATSTLRRHKPQPLPWPTAGSERVASKGTRGQRSHVLSTQIWLLREQTHTCTNESGNECPFNLRVP